MVPWICGDLIAQVSNDAVSGVPLHKIERGIFDSLLKLGRELLRSVFAMLGDGDVGDTVELENGRKLRRLPQLKRKTYRSVFGEIAVERAVYGTRAGQKHEYAPFDAHLQLPANKDSYLLQSWQQQLACDIPFERVAATLDMLIGFTPSTHTLHRGALRLGREAAGFEAEKPAPPLAEAGQILVTTLDGKGVPMRSGAKKMVLVGSSYAVDPYRRTAEQVLAALFEEDGPDEPAARPSPVAKRVHTSLRRDENDSMQPSMDEMFDWLEAERNRRDPAGARVHVVIADGQKSLWAEIGRRFDGAASVEILDIIHVAS
jgi:hypothetical protein